MRTRLSCFNVNTDYFISYKTWSSVSNSTSVLPFIPYPLSLIPTPCSLSPSTVVLLISRNLGEGYCCDCCCDCPKLLVLGLRLEFDKNPLLGSVEYDECSQFEQTTRKY